MKQISFSYASLPFILFIILLFGVVSCKPSFQEGMNSNIQITNRTEIDTLIDQFIDLGHYPVLYTRIENKDGDALYDHGKVSQTMFPGKTVNKDSWFRIWSMSKIVTISLALDFVEDEMIRLDDPVGKYLPELKNLKVAVSEVGGRIVDAIDNDSLIIKCPFKLVEAEREMTILDLINHKAGFYYATTGIECLDALMAEKDLAGSKSNQEFIDKLATLPLVQQPGSEYFYGLNTTVLGFVLERASNKTLKELVKERITVPMSIIGLQYHLPKGEILIPPVSGKDTILRLAYKKELDIFGGEMPTYDPKDSLFLGGEGMVATADGYADFVRMLINGGSLNGYQFLMPETVKEIHSPHTLLDNKHGYNGYNLWVSSDSLRINGQGDEGLWIGGGYEGTHFWADPKREFVGVIMTQIYQVPPGGDNKDGRIRGALYKPLIKN